MISHLSCHHRRQAALRMLLAAWLADGLYMTTRQRDWLAASLGHRGWVPSAAELGQVGPGLHAWAECVGASEVLAAVLSIHSSANDRQGVPL